MRIKEIIDKLYKKKAAGALLVFTVGMAVMAGMSRIADSLMMPRAAVGTFREMSLAYPVEIQGNIEAKNVRPIYGMENLRVGEISVEVNDMVTKGDVLYSIDKDDLADKIEDTERAIKKLILQIEDLEKNYESQENERNKQISRAREDYEDAANSAQNTIDAAYQNMENARTALEAHVNNPPVEAGRSQEEEREKSEEKPADTEDNSQNNEDTDISWEQEKAEWEQKKAELEQNYLQMKQLYDEAVLSGDETLKTASRRIEDAGTEITKDNSVASLKMDLEVLEKSLEVLTALNQDNGKVYTDADGRISRINISVGSVVGAEPAIFIEDSQQIFQFEGEFDSQLSSLVKEGQPCEIELLNQGKVLENQKITKAFRTEEGIYKVSVDIASDQAGKSGEAVLKFIKSSKMYRNCIPLSALFQDRDGYYLLAAAESVTILGVQTTAVKIPVTVAEQNGEYAAVEGNFSGYNQIIVNAGKTVKNGDRIRIVEEE